MNSFVVISVIILILFLFMVLKQGNKENFAGTGGAKFRMSGRKNKCACAMKCDQVYEYCMKRPGSYSSNYCNMRRDLCRRSCFYSDFGS